MIKTSKFEDWKRRNQVSHRLLQAQRRLDKQVEEELNELVSLEDSSEAVCDNQVLGKVNQYAQNYLRDLIKPEEIVSPQDERVEPEEHFCIEKNDDNNSPSEHEVHNTDEIHISISDKYCHMFREIEEKRKFPIKLPSSEVQHKSSRFSRFKISREMKIVIRNAVISSVALVMPFFARVRDVADGLAILIPIGVIALALRPLNETCVGVEVQQVLTVAVSWPLIYTWSVFMIGVATSQLGAFMTLLGILNLMTMYAGLNNPAIMRPMLVMTITFNLIQVNVWKVYHLQGNAEDVKFSKAIDVVDGATFAIGCHFTLHLFGTLALFPWRATPLARGSMKERYRSYAKLLRRLRPVFDHIAENSLDPTAQKSVFGVPERLLKDLSDAREEDVETLHRTQRWVEFALLETRFTCQGEGMAYISRHERILSTSRCARSVATDLLAKLERNYARIHENTAEAEEALEQEKIMFLEREAMESFKTDKSDLARKIQERRRIPLLLTQINLILELGAHRFAILASQSPLKVQELSGRNATLALLDQEQAALEILSEELHMLSMSWMERYLTIHATKKYDASRPNHRAVVKRTKLAAYILVLLQLVKHHKGTLEDLRKEQQIRSESWKREWYMTFPFPGKFVTSRKVVKRESFYVHLNGCMARTENWMSSFLAGYTWKAPIKFALGTTLLVLPGTLESSATWYSSVQVVNAVFTFQVILYKSQTGLMLERTFHRLFGLVMGFIVVGIAWQLACIGSCNPTTHKWILYAAEIVALSAYLWFKTVSPKYLYIAFAGLRTVVSLAVIFVQTEDPYRTEIWIQGGYVVGSSFLGAGVAVPLALFLWPTSGRSIIRESLSEIYQDFIVLFEQMLSDRFEHPRIHVHDIPNVTSFEDRIARNLFVDMTLRLRSAELESMQHINFDAPYDLYVKAVNSTRRIWHALWKLHHLGGIYVYLRDPDGSSTVAMRPGTARDLFAMNRWLTSAFAVVAARFKSHSRDAMPVLRPVAATPHVLEEVLQDVLSRAYSDDVFLTHILASKDFALMCNFPLLNDSLLDISFALDDLFTFMEHFLRKPVYADNLRISENVSFDLYTDDTIKQ